MKKIINLNSTMFLVFNLFIPTIFLILAFYIMPIKNTFQFDTDEGIELSKATLYLQGIILNNDLWNDQPPLFTAILAFWLHLFGNYIVAARLLVTGFATILIWTFAQILRLYLGVLPAIFGVILLMFSANFLRLSISVMTGIPSLALAVLSLYAILLYEKKQKLFLIILSGLFLGLSLQIKMFTVFMIPLLLWQILETDLSKIKKIKTILFWLCSLLLVFLIIGFYLQSLDINHFFEFHVNQNLKSVFRRENSYLDVLVMYLQEFDYVLLTIIGLKISLSQKQKIPKLSLIWLILVTVLLLNHKPIWYHHYLLISIPLTWLATYGVTVGFKYCQNIGWKFSWKKLQGWVKIILIFSLIALPIKMSIIYLTNYQFIQNSHDKTAVVKRIMQYKDSTNFIFTDIAIYSFYTQINLPPEIAVLSRKRVASGDINQEMLLKILDKYHPEQVVLERFPEVYYPILPYLEKNYIQIDKDSKHYILPSLRHN